MLGEIREGAVGEEANDSISRAFSVENIDALAVAPHNPIPVANSLSIARKRRGSVVEGAVRLRAAVFPSAACGVT